MQVGDILHTGYQLIYVFYPEYPSPFLLIIDISESLWELSLLHWNLHHKTLLSTFFEHVSNPLSTYHFMVKLVNLSDAPPHHSHQDYGSYFGFYPIKNWWYEEMSEKRVSSTSPLFTKIAFSGTSTEKLK